MSSYLLIAPEILVLAAAIVALFADVLVRAATSAPARGSARRRPRLAARARRSAAGTGSVPLFGDTARGRRRRRSSRASPSAALVGGVPAVARGPRAAARRGARSSPSLVLFSALGGMLMASARDWVVLLLALELATMPAYVLMGFDRWRRAQPRGRAQVLPALDAHEPAVPVRPVVRRSGMSGSTLHAPTPGCMPGVGGLVVATFLVRAGCSRSCRPRRSTTGRPTRTPAPRPRRSRSSRRCPRSRASSRSRAWCSSSHRGAPLAVGACSWSPRSPRCSSATSPRTRRPTSGA